MVDAGARARVCALCQTMLGIVKDHVASFVLPWVPTYVAPLPPKVLISQSHCKLSPFRIRKWYAARACSQKCPSKLILHFDSPQVLQFSTPPAAIKEPTPLAVSVPETQLQEFKTLLKLSKLASPNFESLQEDGKLGISQQWMSSAKKHWEEDFDLSVKPKENVNSLNLKLRRRESEKRINSFPNFKSKVQVGEDEFDIHFVALFSKKKNAIPILFLHGWPGLYQIQSPRILLILP